MARAAALAGGLGLWLAAAAIPAAARGDDGARAGSEAAAEPTPPEPTPPTGVGGYFDTRLIYTAPRLEGIAPTDDQPNLVSLTEANAQVHLPIGHQGFFSSDTSFFAQLATQYYVKRGDRPPERLPDHDVAGYHPFALINEFYLSIDLGEHLNLTVGKKRIVWGPGLLLNPTDLLNPAKDPTDPTFQRAGAYLLRLEMPFEHVTLTLLGAARARREFAGVPSGLLYDPPYATAEVAGVLGTPPDFDRAMHGIAIARLYALVLNTDVNLFYALSNLYNDTFVSKSRFGVSLAHAIGRVELHAEVLLQLGSARAYVAPDCSGSVDLLSGCASAGTLASYPLLGDRNVRPKALVGAVLNLPGDATFGLEYFYNGEGYDAAHFLAAAQVLSRVHDAGLNGSMATVPAAGGLQKFTFLGTRQHYLLASFVRPHLLTYITATGVAILDMEDQSLVVAPAVSVSPLDALMITLYGYVIGGNSPASGATIDSSNTSEFGLLPFTWRTLISVRAFF